jgi:hypothetical protein
LLDVIDISTPASPVRTGSVTVGTVGTAKGLTLSNGLAYVAANSDGLKIYDPASGNPVLLSTVDTVGDALDVAVKNSMAYVADFPATIDIIDVSALQ